MISGNPAQRIAGLDDVNNRRLSGLSRDNLLSGLLRLRLSVLFYFLLQIRLFDLLLR